MSPYFPSSEPLELIERILRDLLHEILSSKYGALWYKDGSIGLGPEWVKKIEENIKSEQGILKPDISCDLPLAYTDFIDLDKLFTKHEALFKPVFSDWQEFQVFFHTAMRLRNIVKHHRDLSPFQYNLLDGIAGEIEMAVNFWRIGTHLDVKRTIFQFQDTVPTDDRPDKLILGDSVRCVADWKMLMEEAITRIGLDIARFRIDKSDYRYDLQGQHIFLKVHTGSDPNPKMNIDGRNYKGIYAELRIDSSCRASIDGLLAAIGKPYLHLAYELAGNIDVEKLRSWSSERAGLDPTSSISSNSKLEGIEYSLLAERIRVGATKQGHLSITTNSPEGFRKAHAFIDARKLIGFMVGSIPPKSMTYLVRLSHTD